jgi:hypothetical protein
VKPVRLSLSLLALSAAVALGACGDDEPVAAAVVDGTEITQQSVVDELEAIAGNPDYLEALEQNSGPVLGDGEDNFDSAFAAQVLSRQIQYTIVTNEVARRGLEVDDACRVAAEQEVVESLGGFSADGDGQPIYEAFPEAYRDQLVTWNAGVLALQGDLAGQPCVNEAAIEDYFEANRADFTEVCAHHILVATQEEAAAIEAELAAGADFGAIAVERYTDTTSGAEGGDLGCAGAGGYVAEFRDAVLSQDIGVVGPPVESQFGFHVIVVDSREEAVLDDDVRDEVRAVLAQDVQTGFGEWFNQALSDAEVTVDARYGTWNATDGQITRPVAGVDDGTDSTDTTAATTSTTE